MGRIYLYSPCIRDVSVFHILLKEDDQQKIGDIKKILQRFMVNIVYDGDRSLRFTKLILTDYKIMHVLVKNPRMQINEIAREIGIPERQ